MRHKGCCMFLYCVFWNYQWLRIFTRDVKCCFFVVVRSVWTYVCYFLNKDNKCTHVFSGSEKLNNFSFKKIVITTMVIRGVLLTTARFFNETHDEFQAKKYSLYMVIRKRILNQISNLFWLIFKNIITYSWMAQLTPKFNIVEGVQLEKSYSEYNANHFYRVSFF